MDLAAVETALTSWIQQQSGLLVHWRRQAPQAMPFPYIEAELLAISGKGHDEQFWDFDLDTDINSLTMSGVRAMTLSLSFLSMSQSLGASARQHAESFRINLFRPSSIETLYTANLALGNMLSLADTDFVDRSGRAVSQVSVDLAFEMRSSAVDASWDGSYIHTVDWETEEYVIDEFGNPVIGEDGLYVTAGDE